MKNIYKPS